MRVKHYALCGALLALAACQDGPSANPVLPGGTARTDEAVVGPQWTIYTSQVPTETLDASPGWEVGTRFSSSKSGKIVGFRYWRAEGETGSNYASLWGSNGALLASSPAFPAGTGWVEVWLSTPVAVSANTTYRVSVNTNTRQVKTGGGYAYNGHLSNGPLYSDGGYYGQPAGAMPTTESASYFFVDVIFEEDVPLPNLWVAGISPSSSYTSVTVCNHGAGPAGASRTLLRQSSRPRSGGSTTYYPDQYLYTGALAAGTCTTVGLFRSTPPDTWNDYSAMADAMYQVRESNESDNWAYRFY